MAFVLRALKGLDPEAESLTLLLPSTTTHLLPATLVFNLATFS
jgi:hypothetical protein